MKTMINAGLVALTLALATHNANAQTPWLLGGNVITTDGATLGTLNFFDLPIITNGTERMRVHTDGDVTIGTPNDEAARLHVTGNSQGRNTWITIEHQKGSYGPYLELDNKTNGESWHIGTAGSGNQGAYGGLEVWQESTTETRMVIDVDGHMGIGTTAPTAKLEVECSTGPIPGGSNVRFNNLQTWSGDEIPVLLIDDMGYVYRASGTTGNRTGNAEVEVLQQELTRLKEQVEALTQLVKGNAPASAQYGALGSANDYMNIYPNPSNGNVTVKYNVANLAANAKLVVTDVTGKIVAEQPVSNKSGQLNIALPSSIASGNFTCTITDGATMKSSKMTLAK